MYVLHQVLNVCHLFGCREQPEQDVTEQTLSSEHHAGWCGACGLVD